MKKINVTVPFLPPLEEFIPYLEKVWSTKILTNGGPMHADLERELCKYLNVPFVCLFTNATIALLTAFKALNIKGEVITTPYSFVATSHSLLWNGLKPVFVDVDSSSLNIDPSKIEDAININTTAILPVHCYGNSCDVEAIQKIADKYRLKVIYDAAHAFGVNCHCGSILNHGDLSIISFHATKIFNTFEGGAIICHDQAMKNKIDELKNFGFSSETEVDSIGINGKMSEINAAMGLLQLKYVDAIILKRKIIYKLYRKKLSKIKGINFLKIDELHSNFSYMPIMIDSNYLLTRDELYQVLKNNSINSRRYFYPLISEFPIYKDLESANRERLKNAYLASNQVLCLPIYPDLNDEEINGIINIIENPV